MTTRQYQTKPQREFYEKFLLDYTRHAHLRIFQCNKMQCEIVGTFQIKRDYKDMTIKYNT